MKDNEILHKAQLQDSIFTVFLLKEATLLHI